MSLQVSLDHEQRRLVRDRLSVLASGLELNGPYFDDTFIDPVTRTLMLRPAPLYPEWYTQNTGMFTKLDPSAFIAQHPDNWYDNGDYRLGTSSAGPWIASKANAPGWLMTSSSWSKNRAFFLSIFGYSAGDNYILAEFGWGTTANYLLSISCRLWQSGDVGIYKGGVLKGTYNISGAILADQKANQLVDLFLIPCRRRELLVFSRQGNGFSHVFDDIFEDDETPVITPAEKFWVNFPTAKAQFQLAPMRFAATGYATSLDYQFGKAPDTGDGLETFDNKAFAGGAAKGWRIFGDPSYVSDPTTTKAVIVTKDNGVFTPDGTAKDVRLKVIINDGDADPYKDYTPFIYGAEAAYEAKFDVTDNSEEAIINPYLEVIALDVPDDPSRVSCRLDILRPEHVSSTLAAKLLRINNRPCKLANDTVLWLDGQGESPSWEQSTTDDSQRATLEIRDRWKSLESYMFRNRIPLDGMQLTDALKLILKLIGVEESEMDIEAIDFPIEATPGPQAGDYNVVIEVGDTGADWVRQLMEDYAGNHLYGFRPTASGIKFVVRSRATLDSLPIVFELWQNRQSALDDGKAPEDVIWHLVREYKEDTLPPEANEVQVTGWDARTQRPLKTIYIDEDSQDPTLAPSLRPDNWTGDPLLYGLLNAGITSQDICDDVAQELGDRLTKAPIAAEITCELMVQPNGVPVWRGDDIRIHGRGRFRVLSFGFDSEKIPTETDTWRWLPATYCLELVESE